MNIPSHYNRLMPYLIIPSAYKFIGFMKNVFAATEQVIVPRSEGVIMHGELRIDEAVIMFADSTDTITTKPAGLFIYMDNVDDIYAKALAAGATSLMKPTRQDYGYTCGFHDPFGIDWWAVEPGKE